MSQPVLARPAGAGRGYRFLLAFTAFFLTVLALDSRSELPLQLTLAAATWAFVAVTAINAQRLERAQFLTMIGVATCYEYIGSIIWGLYRYRLANLPMYVPPGHGLFYLAALRLTNLPAVRRNSRAVILGVLAAGGLWAVRGAFFSATPDLLGLICWFLLAAFISHGRNPLFFAVSFTLTMALEYYGTALGTWRWAESVPYLGIPAANPPSAIGAGYCVIDATTRLVLQRAHHLRYFLNRDQGQWVAAYVGLGRQDSNSQEDRYREQR